MANPSRSGLQWTEEDTEILKQLWPRRDVTEEDISKVLRRSPQSIYHKTKELKLTPRRLLFTDDIDREYLRKILEVVEG